ncbi:thiamine-monophosphate kinase [Candidatus Nanopelagicus abundans]|uniref:Thiamine-monophosphate kinase n=1 Tax=Candidatus Nanopelagicus abundans TaxID=1884916 RepID=A0A249L520_9ACTN|nr:thiamine-phosphate kinase [Candidatus Nanopelagicus abundans]ASY24025.1 thiamine-monophosphate kinase [Candidatus Nanopelagicus abundans]
MALIESEAGLIARLRDLFHTSFQTQVQVGIGDDAAVIKSSNNKLVATVDMAVEDIHFNKKWSTPFQIGAKLTTANLADIFAMGAIPKYLLVAAGISELNNSETVTELAKGIRSVADKFEVTVIGGDLSKSEKMTLSITALGELSAQPILRSGARVGDLIYLSSLTGLSAAGLAILNRELDRPRYVVEAHLNPKLVAPDKLIKVATSMCDVSDGLATDAAHLSYASNVNFNLSKDLISQAADFKDLAELAKELNEDVFDWILTGGEDHFFLATVGKENESNELGIQIGSVGKGEGKLLLDGVEIKKTGYQHF